MNIDTLAERVAREVLEAEPGLAAAKPIERGSKIAAVLHGSQGAGPALISAFMDDESFGNLRDGWIQQVGGHGMAIQGHAVPHRMVDGVIVGKSVKSLVEDARAFAASPTCVTESYTPVAGVTVAEVVKLGDNIELVPWAEVPDCNQKKVFDSQEPYYASMSSVPVPFTLRAAANMAIRVRSAECKVLFSSHKDAEGARGGQASSATEQEAQKQDIIRSVTLQSERSVAPLGNWARFDKEIANDLIGTGFSYSGRLFEGATYTASRNPVALEAESITRLFRCFESFMGSARDRDSLRISIDRLNQALRRPEVIDKAIDLGIALEVLLLHNIGPAERGELRYRSSIRGAMFLGGDKADRLNTFKLLKDVYDLRSKAVHAGALTAKKNASPPMEILERAAGICARIARNVIERGSFPDWDVEYVIGER